MEIVPSTFIAVLIVAVLLWRGPQRGLWVFMAATPLGAAAAFNLPALGGASIGVVDLAALALFAAVLLGPDPIARLAGTLRPGQPGFWLLLLAVFAVFASLLFPRIFQGQTMVYSLARIDNALGIVERPLRPTSGNITQLFRIFLGVVVFIAVATSFRRWPDHRVVLTGIAVATALNFALGWLDVLTFRLGLEALLDPIRTSNYAIHVNHFMVGLKRMIGGMPEAAAFGYYTLALFGFWLQYWILVPRSSLASLGLLASLVLLLRSTSSSAYVAMVVFLALLAIIGLVAHYRPSITRRTAAIWTTGIVTVWLSALALAGAYAFVEPVTAYLDRSLFDKLATASAAERGSWNAQALRNFFDTWGMGAGLGSVRASNWLLATLASLGVLGTILFLGFLFSVLRVPTSEPLERAAVIRALKAACLAQFTAAMLTHATPDFGIFFFALAGLAVGLSRGGAWESRQEPGKPALATAA